MFKTYAVDYQNNLNLKQIHVASFLHQNTSFGKNSIFFKYMHTELHLL